MPRDAVLGSAVHHPGNAKRMQSRIFLPLSDGFFMCFPLIHSIFWIWLPQYEVLGGSAHHHPGNVKEAQNRTNHSSLSKLSLAILPNIQQHSECQTTVWIVNLLQINETRCEHSQNQHVTWNWYCVTIQCKTFAQCLTHCVGFFGVLGLSPDHILQNWELQHVGANRHCLRGLSRDKSTVAATEIRCSQVFSRRCNAAHMTAIRSSGILPWARKPPK